MESVVKERPPIERIELPGDAHDLPVLAALEAVRFLTPWESLFDDGIHPSLILGAERRSGGSR